MTLTRHVDNCVQNIRGELMEVFEITNPGKVRQQNEDQVYARVNAHGVALGVVCDGLGGHASGEIASAITIETFQEAFRVVTTFETIDDARQWLKVTIEKAHQIIIQQIKQDPSYFGMSTTVVAALIIDGEVIVANVGDSRCYKYESGALQLITEDQTLVNVLYRSGTISKRELKTHPKRHVLLSAVGGNEQIDIDLYQRSISSSGLICLCSDGLYNMISDERIESIIQSASVLSQCGRRLVDEANRLGGLDNISVVLLRVKAGEHHG